MGQSIPRVQRVDVKTGLLVQEIAANIRRSLFSVFTYIWQENAADILKQTRAPRNANPVLELRELNKFAKS